MDAVECPLSSTHKPQCTYSVVLQCTLYRVVLIGAHQLCSCERQCSAGSAAELDTSCLTPKLPGCEQALASWNGRGKKRKRDMRNEGEEKRSGKESLPPPSCRELRLEAALDGVKGGR